MKKKTRKNLPAAVADGQASGDAKFGIEIDACAVELHACIYAGVAMAKVHGISRREIERRAFLGANTLDDYLSSKPDRIMRVDQLAQLLFNPAVLGIEGHRLLLQEIALRNGRCVLMKNDRDEHAGVLEETLEVVDAVGVLAADVREAVDPDSPGGSRITPQEQVGIGADARVVIDESLDLIPAGGDLAVIG